MGFQERVKLLWQPVKRLLVSPKLLYNGVWPELSEEVLYFVVAVGLAGVQADQGTLGAVLADWVQILKYSIISAALLTVYEDCRKSCSS